MAGVSFALSACVVFAVRQVLARHLVDVPNERSLHSRPTPRGGGIGVVLASCLLILAAVWLDYLQARLAYALVGCGLSIALVSLLDDAASLPQLARLAVHAAAAAVLVALVGGYRTAEVPFAGPITLGVTGWILPWLWLIACTNAFNFMDGIDGIAGGFAVVAGLAWVAVGYISGSPFPAVVGAIVAGSSLGFLPQNWSPARIFLGDVGSAFLGFTIGALPLVSNDRPALAFAAVLILWPFLFDTAFTLMRRSLNRERLMAPHRSHLYQRLVLSGWRHATVSLLYMAFGAITSASALWWIARRPFPELAAAGTAIAGAGVLIALVFAAERQRPHVSSVPLR